MPPLQQTIFDSASPIPFADNSPYSSVFDTNLFDPHSQTPLPPKHDTPYTPSAPPVSSEPTSEDIAALFGVAPLPTPSPLPKATPLTVAPPAHYSSLPHHLAQEKSPIAPIPSSPTFYEPPQKPVAPSSLNNTHRYPSYNAYQEQYSEPQQQYYSEPQQQYFEQHTQYQYNNNNTTTNNNNTPETYNYNVNCYSVYNTDDYSQPESRLESTKFDPLMLNPSKPSIFSRFSSTGGAGFGTTPNLAKAVSYMSSTLAVTSTFATEKLATASTKIADLWQHNQTLPQQSQQSSNQDHYNNYYGTTINSGPYYHDGKSDPQPPYETGYGPVSNNVNYALSNNNNNSTNYNPTFGDTKQPPPYEYQPYEQPQQQQPQQQQQPTSGSFAVTATSTLSNAATVATSYLPNLSKLPALKALPLPAMPALPWGSRNKGLPQQQPGQFQYQGSETYSFGQPEQQEQQQQQQQQQPQYAQDAYQSFNNYSYSYSEQIGQGGGRLLAGTGELLQKGRQMVQTGAQAGVAWWWGADSKNPMSNVV